MDHEGTSSSLGDRSFVSPGRLTQLLAELAAAPSQNATSAPCPTVGDRLGRFLLVRPIGQGGFGLVFEAEDTELRRRVALKVVRPRPMTGPGASASVGYLRQEAEAAAQFRHPNVVTLFDAGVWDGSTYLVYELLRGRTLSEMLEQGRVPRAEAMRILRHLARALAHLHAAGVIHRDVKAGNVFIDNDGTVKLLDLGLAQVAGSAGHAAGSPPYAAPEQWRGERADARADVYAWGVLAHQLLTGELPSTPPAPGSHRLGTLRSLVATARSTDPDERPADGGALATALERIERRRAFVRRLRLGALTLAAAGLVIALGWPTEREIAKSVSTSLEAYQRYSDGRRCMDRPSQGESWVRLDCGSHFREALAIDPDFPLAHFALAELARWDSHPTEAVEEVLDRALRQIARLPPREQAQLRAWKAEFDGDLAGTVAILSRLAEQYPDDAHVALSLGEAFYRQGRHAEAIAPLARAVELEPTLELASDELVWSLGFVDRTEELRKLAVRMAASPPSPGTHHAEVLARAWTGDLDRALRVARVAAVGDGGAAREDLEDVLVAAGHWDEAEVMLRDDYARGLNRSTSRLESFLLLRGRVREAREFAASRPVPEDPRLRYIVKSHQVHRLAAERDAAAIERIVDEVFAWSPQHAAVFTPVLAYVARIERAHQLLPRLVNEPGARGITEVITAWRTKGAPAALPALRRYARADPTAAPAIPPEGAAWLAAECAFEADPGPAALRDIHRFQRFFYPLGLWRAWAYPRSLVMEARRLVEIGRPAEASAALERFEALWARADPDLPLLAEARALRARLGTGGESVANTTKASDGRGP